MKVTPYLSKGLVQAQWQVTRDKTQSPKSEVQDRKSQIAQSLNHAVAR
jgi:hypothetical protein